MKIRSFLWKEWLICKRSYLHYALFLYVIINFMLLTLSSWKVSFNENADIDTIAVNYVIKLLFIYVASIFILMSMLNQNISTEKVSGYLHNLLAYKVRLGKIIISKALFIFFLSSIELIFMFLLYVWSFWGRITFSILIFANFILIVLLSAIFVTFFASINILACYIFPRLSQFFSVFSFGISFFILSYYKAMIPIFLNNYLLFSFFSIFCFSILTFLVILLSDKIPKNIILK